MRKIFVIIFTLLCSNYVLAHNDENVFIEAMVTKNIISDEVVVYNLSNAKLHAASCEWAEKCTKNCIYINKSELEKIFYIPCLVCGGDIWKIYNKEDK